MDRIIVDCRRLERLDVVRFKKKLKSPPQRHFGSIEGSIVSGAISAAARVSKVARLLKEIAALGEKARAIKMTLKGGNGPMFKMPRKSRFLTAGLGASSAVFAGVGITSAAGIYGSNKPEFGCYTSAGAGCWTNLGASSELQVAYVFGPPSDFGGVSWGVGVSADMPGAGFGVSCQVMFSASGPPFRMLGFTVGIGVGVSALPADISLTVSSTKLVPV